MTGPTLTYQQRANIRRALWRAQTRMEEAHANRNRLVRDALDAGCTHQEIADATGLSRGRIGQLAQADAEQ